MRTPVLAFCLILLLAGVAPGQDSLNVRLVGDYPCGSSRSYAVAVDSVRDLAFLGASTVVYVLDVSDPTSPVKLSRIETSDRVNGLCYLNGRLYVADYGAGLRVISVTDPAHPVELGHYDSLGSANGVTAIGDYAYVAYGSRGLSVISITDPAHPVEVGCCGMLDRALNVAVSGDYVFVAVSGDTGLRVISVVDPAHPTEVGHCYGPGAADVAVSGDYAYVACGSLRVISVADPAHPVEVGSCGAPGGARGVAVNGDYAYVACDTSGLRVISVADPSHPVEVGHCGTPGRAWDAAMLDGHAYVADLGSRLRVISVTDPAHPVEVGSYDPPGDACGVAVIRDYAYVADGYAGLLVLSVADPAHPVEVGLCGTPGLARNVAVSGDYAYVAEWDSSLRVISVADPAHPVEVGYCSTPDHTFDVAVSGDYAYVAEGNSGLRVISVADPAHPVEVGHCDTPDDAYRVAVVGDYAYVGSRSAGLRVISVADPAHPVEVGYCGTPDNAYGVAVRRGCAYVAVAWSGLWVISVADPAHPVEVGHLDSLGGALDVAVSNDYAYVVPGPQDYYHVRVISVADPAHPVEVGYYRPGAANYVALNGGYVYVDDGAGLKILKFYGGGAEELGDLDVDNDSLDVIADTIRLSDGKTETGYAVGEFVLANTSVSYNPDPEDGPSLSRVDALSFTGSLVGPGGTLDSILLPNLPGSLVQGQTIVCTLAVFMPVGLPDGDYSGSITITGRDVNGVLIDETFYALIRKLGDLDVDNDSLDVVADTIRLPVGTDTGYAVGEFVLANTSALYNPDTADGPSLSPVDSLRFSGSLTGPGGTLDSILLPNLPGSLAQGQAMVCTLALYVPESCPDGDYSGPITITGLDSLHYEIAETVYALVKRHGGGVEELGDLDVDNDSLDVVADTIRARPRPVSAGPAPAYTEYALGEFILANTSTSCNPDTADGPSLSPVDSLSFTGALTGLGGTLDSILIRNLPGSLAQGQTVVCTLAVYVPDSLPDGDYSGSITIAGLDSLHYEIDETVYALVRKLGDLDVDDDSLDVARDTLNLHTQPAGPAYSPYAKAEFMLVNTVEFYNPDTADGPSRSPLREVKVEVKVEAQDGSIDSVYVLNLPESLAVGEAVECTLALVVPVGTPLDGYTGWVAINALDTLGYPVRDSFALAVRGPLPRQNLDSLRVGPIPFKPHQNPEHDAVHFQGLTGGARVIIYDASGQSVWSATESGDGHVAWDAKVAGGIYVYLVVSKDGESRVGKLSVIR